MPDSPSIATAICPWCKRPVRIILAVVTSGPQYWHYGCIDTYRESE